jgi:hypothetical protein
MLDWSHLSARIAAALDIVLGWLLVLPRDVAIVLIAVATSLVLTLARKWFTQQELLGRCTADLKQLKTLLRQARVARDKPAVRRMKTTVSLVKLKQLRAEGRVFLLSIIPLALLAFWAIERLDYLPPKPGQELTLRAYYPLSSVDKLTHLVPPEGFDLKSPAVQVVEVDPDGGANGLATWLLVPRQNVPTTPLFIRHQGRSVTHQVRVDGRIYSPPTQAHNDDFIPATEMRLPQVRFLGVVPGIPAIAFPPWLVAYLLLTILFVPVMRRVFAVH